MATSKRPAVRADPHPLPTAMNTQASTTPTIGITTSHEIGEAGDRLTLDTNYISAIELAGGVPLVIPVLTSLEAMHIAVSRIDALVIPGGPGITEGLIGDLPNDLPPVSDERNQSDRFALESSLEKGFPVLGICYGMQLINAVHGGTLYGDVERDCGVKPHHPRRSHAKSIQHNVSLEPDTHLSASIASADPVNSFHVQAVAELGDDLVLTLRSEDGLVEGFESTDGRTTGVQFHPERQPGTVWDHLFTDLVAKARR
ncbi:MAG: gamma-glutamyl-gamma-aminobutyrate hydrolase [Gemmatimonadetes bacterium]|nr:gamma-glutamyl-gamma-aminobutyrate hydrolase [Gemmatimonadota bacterium]